MGQAKSDRLTEKQCFSGSPRVDPEALPCALQAWTREQNSQAGEERSTNMGPTARGHPVFH